MRHPRYAAPHDRSQRRGRGTVPLHVAQQLDEARRQLHAELQATRQALARTKAALHEQQREARTQQRAVDLAEAEASRARQALASSQREALADAHRAQAELDTLRSEAHDLRRHLQARDQPTDDAQRAMLLGLVDVYDSIHRALAASQTPRALSTRATCGCATSSTPRCAARVPPSSARPESPSTPPSTRPSRCSPTASTRPTPCMRW